MTEPQRPPPPNPMDMLRDPRAVVDTGLGPVAFVTVNALTDLDTAATVAVAISVVVAAYRAIRRHPLTNAIGGVLGTGLCVFIALQAVDRRVLEPRLPPHLFYNLMLAARK